MHKTLSHCSVRAIVADQLNLDESKIVGSSKIIDDLGGDQCDLVEIIMRIEETFNCSFSDDQARNIVSVQDLINCIQALAK